MTTQARENKISRALIGSSLLNEPFAALIPLLPFILLKELHASTLTITVLVIIKPLMSLFSYFYNRELLRMKFSLKATVLCTGIFARLPFILALLSNNPWWYVLACAMYMLFSRSLLAPWMELLRLNLEQQKLQKMFSISSMLSYSLGLVLAISMGFFLDSYTGFWKIVFFSALLVGLAATLLQAFLPEITVRQEVCSAVSIRPIKKMSSLLKVRSDFLRFQIVFMAGGGGLMLLSPSLPIYFCDVLCVNYKDLLCIFSICKAVGFVLSSSYWRASLSMKSINWFTKTVLMGFFFYTIFLFLARFCLPTLFIAYIIYGVFQSASHLVWHLSGPLFAGSQDSAIFSSINVFSVGLRGCFAPLIGVGIMHFFGFDGVLIASSCCFLFGIAFTHIVKIFPAIELKT